MSSPNPPISFISPPEDTFPPRLVADPDGAFTALVISALESRGISSSADRIALFPTANAALCAVITALNAQSVALEPPLSPAAISALASSARIPLDLTYPNAKIPFAELARVIGLQLKRLKPDAVYIRPSFPEPTGLSMPEQTRKALRRACVEENVVLIEDDPNYELAHEGSSVDPVKDADQSGLEKLVYISQVPGTQFGFLCAPAAIVSSIRAFLSTSEAPATSRPPSPANLKQNFDAFTTSIEPILGELRDKGVGRITWTRPKGGRSLMLAVPYGTTGSQFAELCAARGVLVESGESRYPEMKGRAKMGRNTVVLDLGSEGEERVAEGTRIIGEALRELLEKRGV